MILVGMMRSLVILRKHEIGGFRVQKTFLLSRLIGVISD